MCGIIGYIGNEDTNKVIISGLKKLEYRGYDSAGIAGYDKENNFKIIKSVGKISSLEEKLNRSNIKFEKACIGHTRWATHGNPSEKNAHPHSSSNVTLVHNGIIENYIELKSELLSKGFSFYSDTDTEVACKYIDYIYQTEKDKIKCINNAVRKFRGSYAFAIIFKDDQGSIYATRKESPLIIGISSNGNYISSDVSAFLVETKNYILLDNNEISKITKDTLDIYNENLVKIDKEIKTANWMNMSLEKNGYEHFMLKEIYEQPKILKNIYLRYLKEQDYLQEINISKYDNIHIVACGSAYHAGLIGKYLFENYANIPCRTEVASEYRYSKHIFTDKTLIIIISQSGETADTLASLRLAKKNNITTLAIVNVEGSTIAREADIVIYTNAGPEIAVATTKGYTSQVAILSILTLKMCTNTLQEKEYNRILQDMENIEEIISYTLLKQEEYKNIAKSIYKNDHLYYIGRGLDSYICMEGSLKLKEISYIHSESYPSGELKHGTISLINKKTPVIAIATNEELFEKVISNIKEVKARGAFIIFITTEKLDIQSDFYDMKIVLPSTSPFIQVLPISASLQLVSYYTAKLRKCDIDKPKNLAKSVTVE